MRAPAYPSYPPVALFFKGGRLDPKMLDPMVDCALDGIRHFEGVGSD